MRLRINRISMLVLAATMGIIPASAQSGGFLSLVENPSMETNYILLGMALLQVIIILTLSGIMKTLGGNGQVWVDYLKGKKVGMVLLALFAGLGLDAQAATTATSTMSAHSLFWWLLVVNLVFFVIIIAQLVVLKGLVRSIAGEPEEAVAVKAEEPAFVDTILSKLTKRVEPEQEKDILMHHEYDGIRELDNVLPPWWLWLFYATIVWGVVYVVNVHVFKIWPDQDTEYAQEMAQAEVDIAAYVALQAAAVDENTVVALTDASAIGSGEKIFQEFCKACHGNAGEGNAVGPNLTDAYWLHGGSINDVFRTIKYGVVEKGMQSWKAELNPEQMQAVASYIFSIQGSAPANAKEPQGELYSPATEAPVETPATSGSTSEGEVAEAVS